MSAESLQRLFDSFNNLTVLIIGDVMLDTYVYGQAKRISPEAPVPVVNIGRRENRLGGAANVALNIQSLGATPILCSVIGEDKEGQEICRLLKENGISDQGLLVSDQRTTTVKERILSGSQHLLRVDREIDEEIGTKDETTLIAKIKQLIAGCQVVIFEDYDKGILNENVISQAIECAIAKEVPTVVDPKKRNFFHYKNATLFKPNLKELAEGLNLELANDQSEKLEEAIDLLRGKANIEQVMITLSEKGIYISDQNGGHLVPAHVRLVSDVSGAGDTVISIAALGTALKLQSKTIASLANLGGGLVCEYLGVVPVPKDRLLEEAIEKDINLV